MPYDAGKFCDLVKDIPFAMFTTVTAEGGLRSRPMVAMSNAFDGSLWFFTRTGSSITAELGVDGRVNVTYVSAPEDRFVSVSGQATIVRDDARAAQMWSSSYQQWFPGGASDPDLSLIRVDVTRIEYWDRKVGRMTTL
ncbi:MAG: pyridoxamine 5'-phosphate oxidase family protein [Acidobacteriota bacterium]